MKQSYLFLSQKLKGCTIKTSLLTIHFIENSEIKSATLVIFELNERHTAEYLIENMEDIFEAWGIKSDHITSAVSDGAANITKGLETMFGKKRHLHCFAHQLNLVAERAIQSSVEIQSLIKKVKNIVTWFKQSNQLRKAQNENDPKKLIQKVSNSLEFNVLYNSKSRSYSNL
jgi:hypothetical protein